MFECGCSWRFVNRGWVGEEGLSVDGWTLAAPTSAAERVCCGEREDWSWSWSRGLGPGFEGLQSLASRVRGVVCSLRHNARYSKRVVCCNGKGRTVIVSLLNRCDTVRATLSVRSALVQAESGPFAVPLGLGRGRRVPLAVLPRVAAAW